MFTQQFGKMPEVGVIILGAVEMDHGITGDIWNHSGRFAPLVSMYKELLSMFPVTFQHTVDVASGAAESQSSPVFVPIWMVCQ